MIDKLKVARSFSRSACTYDQVAYFQRDVGEYLLGLILGIDQEGLCLDLGCGTGYFREFLVNSFPRSTYLGLDIAEGMLRYCQQRHPSLLCADAEYLPLSDESCSLIYSNLAVQWCDDLPQLFGELYRVLKSSGTIAFSTLGPETLLELKQAWSAVDNLVHVNSFKSKGQWQQAILDSGFTIEQSHIDITLLRYRQVKDLLDELKTLGAHNVNEGQRQGLTGRRRIQGLLQAYQAFYTGEYYPATYEVLFWVLRKSH